MLDDINGVPRGHDPLRLRAIGKFLGTRIVT